VAASGSVKRPGNKGLTKLLIKIKGQRQGQLPADEATPRLSSCLSRGLIPIGPPPTPWRTLKVA